MVTDNSVDLKLNLDFQGVNDALYQMIGQFNGTDKEFQKIASNMQKNAKNLEAAIKLFGPASQQAGAAAIKLQKDFQSLVANGIDPASASFKKMTASMPTSAGLDQTTGSLRKNNMQWTNLALVLQDLPFGFRGIQNNLPALAGGFAKMTGPIYLGISAVIAAITAWDMGLFKTKKATDDLKNSQDELNKALANSKNEFYSTDVLLTNYVKIARDANSTDVQRKNAISEVNKVLGEYGIKLDENTIKTGKSEEAIKKVTEAMLNQALIAAYKDDYVQQAKLLDKEKELAGQAKITAKTAETASKKGVLGYAALSREIDVTGLASKSYNNEAEVQWLKQEQKVLDVATGVEKIKTKILDLQKAAVAGLLPVAGGGKKDEPKPKDTYSKDFQNALEEEQRLFKENLDNQLSYAEGNDVKKVQLLSKGMSDLISWYNLGIIEESFYQNTIADLYKQTYNLKASLLKKEQDDEENIAKIIVKNRESIADGIKKINSDMNNENIKNVQTELDQTLRATRGNYNAQKDAYQMAIDKLKEKKAALDAAGISTDEYNKKIQNLEAGMAGLVDPLEQLNQAIQSAFNQLQIDMLTSFGEAIGDLVSGEKFDMSAIGTILADAVISLGKALITYGVTQKAALAALSSLNPIVAIAGGVLAVAAGTALKNKLKQNNAPAFANGGIVSGPTMGLVGEYPGAKSNPEVIAPLDKLKSMIGGGGGGTFVLRGQDLLLATNRAQKASNLKGQNISLA
jgi:exonuclease VII small subunit